MREERQAIKSQISHYTDEIERLSERLDRSRNRQAYLEALLENTPDHTAACASTTP